MSRFPGIKRLFRTRKPESADEVDDELRFHLDAKAAELEATGMSANEARRAALAQFGDWTRYRDQTIDADERMAREARLRDLALSVLGDVRYALRGLRRTPVFTAAAVTCIALGIAVTTTILSAANAVLIRPLPYHDADRLVAVYAQNVPRGYHGTNISYPDYASWRDQNTTLSSLGLWTWSSHALSDGEAERVDGSDVTADLFPTLGVRPVIGRTFTRDEETRGRNRVVLLSDGLWRRRFGGDTAIVGRAITLDGVQHTVIGVMPPNFNFPVKGDVWVPFVVDLATEQHGNRGYAGAIGRLKPGVSLEQAQADLAVVSARLERDFPEENSHWAAEAITLRQDLTGDLRGPVFIFLGAVGLVLLIACANVANLTLARGMARRRELAVRAALGAGRGRVVRLLLAESVTIALIGGAMGTLLAVWGVRLLRLAFPGSVPFYLALRLDGTVMLAACAATVITGLAFGVVPALRAARLDSGLALRDDARSGDGVGGTRLRSSLATIEVALSVVLLTGAMLFVRSYRAYTATDLGFTEHGILTARISLPASAYGLRSQRVAFYDALIERLRGAPGVVAVGAAQGIPFSGWDVQSEVSAEGHAAPTPGEEPVSHYQWVTPDYFKAMGVSLVSGRALTAADRDSVTPTAVVNETFVRKLFPNENPIGRRVKTGGPSGDDPWMTIVGVVRDYRHYRLPTPMGPAMFLSAPSRMPLTMTIAVRTTLTDPHDLAPILRSAVRELDSTIPIYDVKTIDEAVARSLWRQRLNSQVLAAFAALALVLSAVGIYGVISYAVAQRTRELGVRVALGATRADVMRTVVGQGVRIATAGVTTGVITSVVASRALTALLYEVHATDPLTFVVVPAIVGAAVLLASSIPAFRATRVDPLVAIRAD